MIIACPDCGLVQCLPSPPRRGYLQCCRCGGILERRSGRSLDAAFACAIATFLLLFPANLLPLVSVRGPAGVDAHTYLGSGCGLIWDQGWPLAALLLGLQGILLPFLRFGFLVAALGALRLGEQPRWTGRAFRYAEYLDLWAMPDVLLIGGIIGYGRIAVFVPTHLQDGGLCLVAAAVLAMLTRATLDRRAVWRRIALPADAVPVTDRIACIACDLVMPGDARHCRRCGAPLYRRKPFSLMRTNALLLTALLLLPVANYFPASLLWEVGALHPRTIFTNIRVLFQQGYAPVGLLIFCTSMMVPVLKVGGVAWFSLSVMAGSSRALSLKTRFYRTLETLGRWSNLDPFSVMIFAPILQFGPIAHVTLGGGGPAFLAVLVISTLAIRVFDPRLMWDCAGKGGPGRAAVGSWRDLAGKSFG
jgi:paraquat-inducible protein A